MKHFSLFTIAFILLTSSIFADEFIVKSFKQIENKILTNNQKVYDDNDELCAIILVRTSLINLGISASTPIVGSPKRTEGDIRVHLSAGTRMIKFFKDGFSTFEYVFPKRVEKGSFYIIELEYRRTDVTVAGNTMGFVLINSEPQGADVYINDEPTGQQTPFQNPYNEGYYSFTLKKSFYGDYKGDFTIKPGETTQKDINLTVDYGSVNVSFNPSSDVSVNIDGKISTQSSPYHIEKLKPGKHNIVLNKATYDEYKTTFSISKGETTNLNIEMLADFGGITISTSPEINASISIDGVEHNNTTPFTLYKLSPGKHLLRLSKSMYITHEDEFVIEKGKNNNLNISLVPNFGIINISASVEDDIYIDNQKVGSGTVSRQLLKGKHIIEIKRENHYAQSRQIDMPAGSNINETFKLLPKTGTLQVMTAPMGVDVFVNGKLKGQTPMFVNDLIIGTYTLKLQKQGHATVKKQIEITENQTTAINETLPSAIEVQITSIPSGAKLYVDDQYKGITPQTLSLSFESRSFKLSKDKYKDYQTTKTITTTVNRLNFEMEAIVPKAIDKRDGQTYKTVTIGKQIWMAENLNYKTKKSWCYDNNETNCDKYGRLYKWKAAKKACPSGWHLPSDEEWKELEMYLGMSITDANKDGWRGNDEGKKMKSKSGWGLNNGTNSSGFNALPGGYRGSSGSFYYLGGYGDWWSSSESSGTRAWHRRLYYDYDQARRGSDDKTYGFSVRCLKN